MDELSAHRALRTRGPAVALLDEPAPAALRPPTDPVGHLRRPRLLRALDRAARAPVTVVSAPAGYGKSTLLAAWAARRRERGPVAWVSLDAEDGDPVRFWAGVTDALRAGGVDALEAARAPVVLVLDDLHELAGTPAATALARFLRHPPAALRLVAGVRGRAPLSLERQRVAGRLSEVGADELAFTETELAALLERDGLTLDGDAAQLLWRRTEGWPAGVRLCVDALRREASPALALRGLSGAHPAIGDYLAAEVLDRLAGDDRTLLLRLSVAGTVGPELARALTGEHAAADRLGQLAQAGALLAPDRTRRGWYRIHPLLGDALAAERERALPGEAPELHRRAAEWQLEQGDEAAAIRHAVSARAGVLIARLAGRRWLDLLMRGDRRTLHAAVAQLPPARVETEPELALACAAALLEAGEPAAAARHLERAAAQGSAGVLHAAAWLHHARVTGDVARAREAAAALLAEPALAELPERDAVRAFGWASLGAAELWSGELDAAARALGRGARAAARAGHDQLLLSCRALLALQASLQGRLGACAAAADEALALSATHGWERSWPTGAALLAQAGTELLWNRLGAAETSLARAVDALSESREAPLRALLGYSEARRLEARGALDRALQTMQAANDELGDWPLRPELGGLLRAHEELLLAATGEQAAATAHLAARAATCPPSALALASLRLAAGDPGDARRVLARLPDDIPALISIRIELRVVDALAADALLDHAAAAASLTGALAIAEPAGYRRPLLGHGGAIAPLLRRAIRAGTPHRALVGELLGAIEAGSEERPGPKLVADALSGRELMVLRYLPTVLTNSEIAAELFVSVNTVKTHVKSIYRKLDVSERRSAVRRARELRLLAP